MPPSSVQNSFLDCSKLELIKRFEQTLLQVERYNPQHH